jgi:Ca-activated chloride channel family protein
LTRSGLALLVTASWFLTPGQSIPAGPAAEPRPDHAEWLGSVALLISAEERAAFAALTKDYQRDAFMRRFWEVRDPFPQTAKNEFREAWEERAKLAAERWDGLTEDRAQIFLVNGEPRRAWKPLCSVLRPIEIWDYAGTDRVRGEFTVVFSSPGGSRKGPYRLWSPQDGLASLVVSLASASASTSASIADPQGLARFVAQECSDGSDILGSLSTAVDWHRFRDRFELVPEPGDEWVRSFAARSTELPAGAVPLAAQLSTRFPGRHQSRTIVETLLRVPREELEAAAGKTPAYSFLVDGEVLLRGDLFENFRYRFDLPVASAPAGDGSVPLVVQRYLRPGSYTMVLKLEDLSSHRFFRSEQTLDVPAVEAAPVEVLAAPGAAPPAIAQAVANPLAEADRDLDASDDWDLKLYGAANELVTGRLRVEATVAGEGVAWVEFALNGRRVLTKSRPPWGVELDVGKALRTHRVRAAALDAAGRVLASDEILVNAGPYKFRVRLLQPERGRRYQESLRAHAEVAVPPGEKLDRVEFFLNEDRVATLYQPPYVQPILLPGNQPVAYVRAVAYLADGSSSEDLVFVNAPEISDEIEVSMVELYTSVVGRGGRPVDGLDGADFVVFEDGQQQELRRFETVANLPIHAGIVLDTSSSMEPKIADAVKAALRFFETVLEPKDRAAVVTFADKPVVAVPFTNSPGVLAGGLINVRADGETALWDAIAFSLHYFSGLRGKRCLIVLTDGEDVSSRYRMDDVLDFAKRTGVAIYPVAIGLSAKQVQARAGLQRFADATGGRLHEVSSALDLTRIYDDIEKELRSQYLLVYQSPQTGDKYREIEVKVRRPGATAKAMRGYYP